MNLTVRPSQIPNAGMGLFTEEQIEAGELVVEYTGDISSWEEIKGEWRNVYIYYVSEDHVINAQHHPEVYARYANDAKGITHQKKLANNCEFVNNDNRIFIRSLRMIMPGEELLVAYGDDYWETVRKNSI